MAATELHQLLQAAQISQPLLLVAHSYGGIVAREYLHLHPERVAGMVLSDSSTERQSEFFQVPDPNINAVMGALNFAQVTGLKTDSKLSREEWRTRAIDISRGYEAAQAEAAAFVEVCETLKSKEQYRMQALGDNPLSVIRCNSARDYERIYEKGVEVGNGTEEQRVAFRRLLDGWENFDREIKEELLQLSSETRLLYIPDCGHNVHLVRPDVVAEEIRWVRDKILERISTVNNSSL
jgi:pimeloyl-ACP methyl ester carboxylesterase